jgi:hypothetical protein
MASSIRLRLISSKRAAPALPADFLSMSVDVRTEKRVVSTKEQTWTKIIATNIQKTSNTIAPPHQEYLVNILVSVRAVRRSNLSHRSAHATPIAFPKVCASQHRGSPPIGTLRDPRRSSCSIASNPSWLAAPSTVEGPGLFLTPLSGRRRCHESRRRSLRGRPWHGKIRSRVAKPVPPGWCSFLRSREPPLQRPTVLTPHHHRPAGVISLAALDGLHPGALFM